MCINRSDSTRGRALHGELYRGTSCWAVERAACKLEEIIEIINPLEMPLVSYALVHDDARLTAAQSRIVTDWADNIRQRILAINPLKE